MSGILGPDGKLSAEQTQRYLSPSLSHEVNEKKGVYDIGQRFTNLCNKVAVKFNRIGEAIKSLAAAFEEIRTTGRTEKKAEWFNNSKISKMLLKDIGSLNSEFKSKKQELEMIIGNPDFDQQSKYTAATKINELEKQIKNSQEIFNQLVESGAEKGKFNLMKASVSKTQRFEDIRKGIKELENHIEEINKKLHEKVQEVQQKQNFKKVLTEIEGKESKVFTKLKQQKSEREAVEPNFTPPDVLGDRPVPDDKPVATRKERVLVKEKKRTFNVGVTPEERARLSKKVEERPIYKAKRKGEKALRASEELKNKISYYGEALPAEALGSVESLNKILLSMKIRCIDLANINKLNDLIQDKTLEDLSKNTKLLDEVVGTLDLILDHVEVALLTSGSAKKDDKGAFVEFNNKEIGEAYKAAEICYDKLNDFLAEMLHKEKSLKS